MPDSSRSLHPLNQYSVNHAVLETPYVKHVRATHASSNRTEDLIALKPQESAIVAHKEAFLTLYEGLSEIKHPYLARIHRVIAADSRVPFAATQSIAGHSLQAFIDADRTIHAGRIAHWFIQLARLIDTLEAHGIRSYTIQAQDIIALKSGQVVLFPSFTPDPVGEGDLSGVQQRIYELAGIMYSVLTGAPPSTDETLLNPAGVPLSLIKILSRCLTTNPTAQYPSGDAVARDLEILYARKEPALDRGPQRRQHTTTPRIPSLALFLGFIGLSALIGGIFLAGSGVGNQPAPQAPAAQPSLATASAQVTHPAPILDLTPYTTFQSLMNQLVDARNQGLVAFGRAEDFVNTSRCYIFVFDRNEGSRIAILSPGQATRTDMLSDTNVQDPASYLLDKAAIWVLPAL